MVYQTVQEPGKELEQVPGVGPDVIVDVEEFFDEDAEVFVFHWELVDWFDDPRPKPKKVKKPVETLPTPEPEPKREKEEDSDSEPESPIELLEDDNDVLMVDVDSSDDEEDEWIPHIEEANGSSGGFFAMKDLPYENSSEKVYQDHPQNEWEDVLNNTVWRPRRVGEKTVKIDMDRDIDEFLDDNELIVDGGFDCSHSPFPVSQYSVSVCQKLIRYLGSSMD